MKEFEEREIKLSFLGDITCDRPMLKAAKRSDGTYHFEDSLKGLRQLFSGSDYVIGNLETVCAGEELGYNPGAFTYNSPDVFLSSLKQAGITMLTTANNHCLDCGGTGVDRTLRLLEELELDHTGTYPSGEKNQRRYLIKEINGIRIAFAAFTDQINAASDGTVHSQSEWDQVNHLRVRRSHVSGSPMKIWMKKLLPMKLIRKLQADRKRRKGIPLVAVRVDDTDIAQEDRRQIGQAVELLTEARKNSDFVVACIHCGGQFNGEPGRYSVQMYDLLEPYVDAVIGNHPHVVQRAEIRDGKVRAYSLGSVNMSPSADYVSQKFAPDYSVVLNLYLKRVNGKVISRMTFSMLHAREDENAYVTVCPVDEDCCDIRMQEVFRRFSGKDFSGGSREHTVHAI